MGFHWPWFLLLLGLIPLILAAYFWLQRRRRRYALRYSSLLLVREALPQMSRIRRYLPLALFLLALAGLAIAMSRPYAVVQIPTGQATIILAMDVSRSMCSIDIRPNRLEVAKSAALSFIQNQKSNTQIGIVAFAGFAELIQPPTTDQEALQAAITGLTTGRRTAIGSAILEALDAIAEINENVAPSVRNPVFEAQPTPVPEGAYAPDIIVLLSDGASNAGPLPLEAAQQAAARGVRIYTIGYGTENGGVMDCGDQFQMDNWFGGGGQGFGGDPQFGGWFRRSIDEPTLREIAAMTGGEYYSATSADELNNVFRGLPTYLATREEISEISVVFAAVGALLALLAMALSLIWHPLP